jgi:hypothetical protein
MVRQAPPWSTESMLLLASSVKLVAEIALMALAGRWLLGLLAGERREQNFFYQLLHMLVRPFLAGARLVSPRIVLDRHVPLVTFLLLALAWVVATFMKIQICLQLGVQACR